MGQRGRKKKDVLSEPLESSEHVIPVRFDPQTHSLVVDVPSYTVQSGDLVIWQIQDLPAGWTPWILVDKVDRHFEGLSQSGSAVWGRTRKRDSGKSLTYRATIQKGMGKGAGTGSGWIRSARAGLALLPFGSRTKHVFEVYPDQDKTLRIEPTVQDLRPGDAVEWRFFKNDKVRKLLPRVDFKRFSGKDDLVNQHLGPFTSLSYQGDSVIGKGNNGVPGAYFFRALLVGASSNKVRWVSSVDPVVDNMGDPDDPLSG